MSFIFSWIFVYPARRHTHRWSWQKFNNFFFQILFPFEWICKETRQGERTMTQCIILLLVFLVHRAHDVVFAKPGFDEVPALSLNSFRYSHELHRQYHLDNGIEFVKKQMSKASSLNTNVAKNAILFLGDGMSGELQLDRILFNYLHSLKIDSCLLFSFLSASSCRHSCLCRRGRKIVVIWTIPIRCNVKNLLR